MKKIYFFLLVLFMFSEITCKKQVCHHTISIRNNSLDSVIIALKWRDNNLCHLNGDFYLPGTIFPLKNRDCWESYLSDGKTQEIFIVDRKMYNDPLKFYNCDSIEIKNKVLKHFTLTLNDLQSLDFVVTYP